MKKYTLLYIMLFAAQISLAQENVYPAKKQEKPVFISNGTVHVGNGTVLNNASILAIQRLAWSRRFMPS